jgi:hypothetical protein
MNRPTASLVVLLVAAVTVVAVPAASLAPGGIGASQDSAGDATEVQANGTNAQAAANASENASIPPGSQLTGIVGVQKAEIEGEVATRSFDIALNRSGGNASKQAAVVARQVTDLESRLADLRDRKAELDRARANDTITESEYRARIAEVAARTSTVKRLANRTENATRDIPEETLRENGVNATAIAKLKAGARNLSGPEVAEIARSIAGPGAGTGLGANVTGPLGDSGPPVNAGPPGDDTSDNETDDESGPLDNPGLPGESDGNETASGGDGPGQNSGAASALRATIRDLLGTVSIR